MKFSEAKSGVLKALREHRIEHEARDAQTEKNLLATKMITVEEAVGLVESTRGNQASSSPHHGDSDIQVWIFRPRGWYIKFYLVGKAWFISFHREELL
jgi:hypothetical protein